MKDRVLRVQDLGIDFKLREGGLFSPKAHVLKAVNGVSFDLNAGETLGIVGESGSGKSQSAFSVIRLMAQNARHSPESEVIFDGKNLMKMKENK